MTLLLRSLDRKNKIIKTFTVGAYAKIIGVLVTFAMVPLGVDYLGTEQYGLWVAVSSLIAMLSFTDAGVGNALVNMISRATGIYSKKTLQPIISTSYFVIAIIAILGAVVFFSIYRFISWEWVFGITNNNLTQLSPLILIVGLAFFLGMPFTVVGNIQRGFQEGNIQAFWTAKGRLLSLLFVYIVIQMDLGILGFAAAFVSGPIAAGAVNSINYFILQKKELFPRFSFVTRTEAKTILGIGSLFFILQVTSSIQMQADNIIIANMLGPSLVTPYAICMQLFMAVPMIMTLFLAPLWPAYSEALASKDNLWIKLIFIKSIKVTLMIGVPTSILLVFFGKDLIHLWVGKEIVVSSMLLIGFGFWMLMMLVGNTLAVLLNGLQIVKTQIIISITAAVFNFILTVVFISYIGVEGAVYGSIVSYLICVIIPYSFLIPVYFRKLEV